MKELELAELIPSKPKTSPSFWQKDLALGPPVKLKEKQAFYQQWALLLASGLALADSLSLLQEQSPRKPWPTVLNKLRQALVEGQELHEAFAAQDRIFGNFELQSIKMAERSGRLPEVLQQLGQFFAQRAQLQRKVWQALTYPIAVVGIASLVLAFMLGFVVPMFADIFARFDAELPAITQWIMGLAAGFRDHGGTILLLTILVLGMILFLRHDPIVQDLKGRLLIQLPGLGALFRKLELARISYSLSLLLEAHVHLDQALQLSAKMATAPPFREALLRVQQRISQGESFSASLQEEALFPSYFRQMIRVGEESARLPEMMDQLARQLETESEATISQFTQFLEPVMIIFLGGIVAIILVAMYLPMFTLSQAMVQ